MTEYFPGTDCRVPSCLTDLEAAFYLRFTDTLTPTPDDAATARRQLEHLRRNGHIHGVKCGRCIRYARTELDRFMDPAAEDQIATSA